MAPFKFPPPPPPPPSTTPNDAPTAYGSQRGGYSGRGERGRGRGGAARGRGHNQAGPNSRGGHLRGGHRGGQQLQGIRGGSQNYGRPNSSYQQPQQHSHAATPGYSGTNPAPVHPSPSLPTAPVNNVPPLDPGAFAQAMSFMATPAGMQSMAAFATHMANGNVTPTHTQSVLPQQPIASGQSAGPQPSPRKRKRVERAEQWQSQKPSNHTQPRAPKAPVRDTPLQKPPRAKAKAAPSIPGFGFSLPQVPKSPVTSKPGSGSNVKKKGVNLGLTNMSHKEEPSSEEDELEDEEAALAAKWDGKGLTFEHNGEVISLQTAAEFAEFIKDRKKNFPTQQKIAEKAQRAAEKRAGELEFLRRVKGPSRKARLEDTKSSDKPPEGTPSRKAPSTKPNLQELREKVKSSMLSKKGNPAPFPGASRQAVDLGLGYGTGTDSDGDSSVLSESSVVSSSESSEDDDSDAHDDEAEGSDAPPEAQSSKIPAAPVAAPPPLKLPDRTGDEPSKSQARVCQQWKKTGKCKYKYCRYRHAEEEPKRVGLYEKMVQQELEKADRLALEAIKYLGRNGYLG